MTTPYDDFERAMLELVPEEEIEFGSLGFTVKGEYHVIVPEKTHLYRVVIDGGTFREIPHRGNCAPKPDMRVVILKDEQGKSYIDRTEEEWLSQNSPNTSGQYNVAHHSHARGSGMEFILDTRLIGQFYAELQGDMRIFIRPGIYYYNAETKYWAGDFVDLTSNIPVTSGFYKWVVIAFDPIAETISVIEGPEMNFLNELIDLTRLPEISVLNDGKIPICAVQLKYGMRRIADDQVTSMADVLSTGVRDTKTPQYLYQETTDQIITAGAWRQLTWDSKFDPIGLVTINGTNDAFTLVSGDWLLKSVQSCYVQQGGLNGNMAIRLQNVTQSITIKEAGTTVSDVNIDGHLFNLILSPVQFSSDGTDEFSLDIYAVTNDFRRAFPTVLELQRL